MKKFDDISWGRMPERDYRKEMKREIDLIYEWREWNSDLKVAESLIDANKNESSLKFGKNVYKKCKREMQKICKEIRALRKENEEN